MERNEVPNRGWYFAIEGIRGEIQALEVLETINRTGNPSPELIPRKIDVGQVGAEVPGEEPGEVGARDADGPDLLHVAENYERATGVNHDVGDGEIGEVLEAGEPDPCKPAEAADGGEGAERQGELGREGNGGNGAVLEAEGLEGGEGPEGGEGESDVVGAVEEAEGEEVAERLGGVAEGDVVAEESWLSAGIFGGGNVERLEGSELFRVEG
ncbi:hypothetical protein PanWU01x14_292110 [Parasponia andersonii]|uniref:Uncharacterized protein n=1 Tax=Parasponia andersonii TaxID=3476 RepID=A0A2P5AX80_PARAD|nr:hypothetical protein PanWU01x14_292110 [Parasponia andersonii]